MRNGTPNRRSRGRGGASRKSGNQRTQVFDSNGPDVRIRGTAHQVCEKYLTLAKDADSTGDRILSESYLQHAEHYQRIICAWNADNINSDQRKPQQQPQQKRAENSQENSSGNKAEAKDDLSLPSSILEAGVEAETANKRTATRTDEPELLV